MQYLRFLVYLCQQHVQSYKNFKFSEPIRQYAAELNRRATQSRHDQYKHACKVYGVKTFKTLKEIAKADAEFELNNPELFPGLFKDNE